jgi:hypothetical protein
VKGAAARIGFLSQFGFEKGAHSESVQAWGHELQSIDEGEGLYREQYLAPAFLAQPIGMGEELVEDCLVVYEGRSRDVGKAAGKGFGVVQKGGRR